MTDPGGATDGALPQGDLPVRSSHAPAAGIRSVFDGAFIGPMLPPPAPLPPRLAWFPARPVPAALPEPPPPTEAVLAIPLHTRGLVRESLDMLTRSDSGLRGPSFYIGFMMLVTFG
ncbi:MAG: hypothetical protein ACYC65_14645, partial [Candidatus Limnocylindrales bacterium]